ncbi:MAG: hypothetical protein ACJAXE_002492, partial [Neolewinella sp.]
AFQELALEGLCQNLSCLEKAKKEPQHEVKGRELNKTCFLIW